MLRSKHFSTDINFSVVITVGFDHAKYTRRIIHHNQLLLIKFGTNFVIQPRSQGLFVLVSRKTISSFL